MMMKMMMMMKKVPAGGGGGGGLPKLLSVPVSGAVGRQQRRLRWKREGGREEGKV